MKQTLFYRSLDESLNLDLLAQQLTLVWYQELGFTLYFPDTFLLENNS